MITSTQKATPVPIRLQGGILDDVDTVAEALMLSRPDVIRFSVFLGLPRVIKCLRRDKTVPASLPRMRKCARANAGHGKAAA